MSEVKLSIARDFSEFPAGRSADDGPFSGSAFRDEVLAPKLTKGNDTVVVDLDGTMGYGSSFLEEAFGGLVRHHKLFEDVLRKRLKIHDSRHIYENIVWSYIADESERVRRAR